VIYYCNCQTTGYEIAKEFENEFLNKVLEKVVSDEEPKLVHPIDDEQKIYDFKEEVVVTENSTMNKIFSIFKGSLTNSDNNKDK
jgi:predicted nuclease of restriction endonuclease-like RecB superfamily